MQFLSFSVKVFFRSSNYCYRQQQVTTVMAVTARIVIHTSYAPDGANMHYVVPWQLSVVVVVAGQSIIAVLEHGSVDQRLKLTEHSARQPNLIESDAWISSLVTSKTYLLIKKYFRLEILIMMFGANEEENGQTTNPSPVRSLEFCPQ